MQRFNYMVRLISHWYAMFHLHVSFYLYTGETMHASSLQNDCPGKCLNQDFLDYWIFRIQPLIATTYTIS